VDHERGQQRQPANQRDQDLGRTPAGARLADEREHRPRQTERAQARADDVKARGPQRRLAWFTAAPELDLFGGEIVLIGDRVAGRVTSAGYGYTVGRSIFCAYVAADEPVASTYSIEVMGERYAAVRHTRPLYDPDRRAIMAA